MSLIIHDVFLAGDVEEKPHLVPRKGLVVDRPISELNKWIIGLGFISLFMFSVLIFSWAFKVGENRRGVSSLKSSATLVRRILVLVGKYGNKSLYQQVVEDSEPRLGI